MRPSMTALPPIQSTVSVPKPAMSPMSGANCASTRASARLRRTYSSFDSANEPIACGSIVYARTTVIPARYSCTRAERTPSCVWTASLRSCTVALKRRTRKMSSGYGDMAQSVSQGSTAIIAARAPTNVNTVPLKLGAPGTGTLGRSSLNASSVPLVCTRCKRFTSPHVTCSLPAAGSIMTIPMRVTRSRTTK